MKDSLNKKNPYLCFFLLQSILLQFSLAESAKKITAPLLQELIRKDYKQRVKAVDALYAHLDSLQTSESIDIVIGYLKTQTHPQVKSTLSKYLKNRVLFHQEKSLLGVAHIPVLISLKGEKTYAMRIEAAPKGTAAEKSGLKPYDLITKINGESILLKKLNILGSFDDELATHHFSYLIKKHKPGTTISVEVLRNGENIISKEVKLTACAPFKPFFIKEQDFTPEILKETSNLDAYTDTNKQNIYYKFWLEEFVKKKDIIAPIN